MATLLLKTDNNIVKLKCPINLTLELHIHNGTAFEGYALGKVVLVSSQIYKKFEVDGYGPHTFKFTYTAFEQGDVPIHAFFLSDEPRNGVVSCRADSIIQTTTFGLTDHQSFKN